MGLAGSPYAFACRSYANKSGMKTIYMPMMPGLPGMVKQDAIDYVKLHKVLHDDGFHVLAYDQRNHGESERRLPSGWGVVEFQDAAGAMDYTASSGRVPMSP